MSSITVTLIVYAICLFAGVTSIAAAYLFFKAIEEIKDDRQADK